jgi:predicted CopG family antitoxin
MLFLRKLFESLSGFLVELIERKAVTKDIKAIGNISDIPVQHRVMELIRDEKEIKQLYANTPNSFDRTASILKGKRYSTNRDYPTFKVNVFGLKYPI